MVATSSSKKPPMAPAGSENSAGEKHVEELYKPLQGRSQREESLKSPILMIPLLVAYTKRLQEVGWKSDRVITS